MNIPIIQRTIRVPSLSVARADDTLLEGSPATVPPQKARLDLTSSLEARTMELEFAEVHGIHYTCLGNEVFLAFTTRPNVFDKDLQDVFRSDGAFQVEG